MHGTYKLFSDKFDNYWKKFKKADFFAIFHILRQ